MGAKTLNTSIEELEAIRKTVAQEPAEAAPAPDKEWLKAIRNAERKWTTFCDDHPATAVTSPTGYVTPRNEKVSLESDAAARLREALEIEELESPVGLGSGGGALKG